MFPHYSVCVLHLSVCHLDLQASYLLRQNLLSCSPWPAKPWNRDIATARIEQLAPFPFHEVADCIARYPKAEIVWVQEEPKNMGAYAHVFPRLLTVMKQLGDSRKLSYIGRPPSASPATGQYEVHVQEMKTIVDEALA